MTQTQTKTMLLKITDIIWLLKKPQLSDYERKVIIDELTILQDALQERRS